MNAKRKQYEVTSDCLQLFAGNHTGKTSHSNKYTYRMMDSVIS
jgi:hypothetical protein